MTAIEKVRADIARLGKRSPNVHLDVSISNPKLSLQNTKAKIVGVYPHVFRIEENVTGEAKCHTLQYTDVLTGNIRILELETGKG